jgi:hypothetical protein
MPEQVKDMWKWYTMTLMTFTARKDWKWKNQDKRCEELFTDCVRVGDEAFALSILELKGEEYMKGREQRKQPDYKAGGRGRRKKGEDDQGRSEDGLNHRVAAYLKYRENIEDIRSSDEDDELGWCEYILKCCLEARLTKSGKWKGVLIRNR